MTITCLDGSRAFIDDSGTLVEELLDSSMYEYDFDGVVAIDLYRINNEAAFLSVVAGAGRVAARTAVGAGAGVGARLDADPTIASVVAVCDEEDELEESEFEQMRAHSPS